VSARVVTLVASDAQNRAEISRYLQRSGFEVRRSRVSDERCTMVWLTEPGGDLTEVIDTIIAWLAEGDLRCAIVVTMRPAAFRRLLEEGSGRLVVLPAPAFGWQIVDALWAAHRGHR
jgi:NADPH:quinone reductase-like Zn-dependent oxidoreductase